MKKYFSYLIFITILSFPFAGFSQQEKKPLNNSDTLFRFQGIIPPVEYQYNLNKFFVEPLFNDVTSEILFEVNPSTIWLRTELLISNNSQPGNGEVNTFFTAPLYQQYLRDSEFDMVRYVLGAVQAGAVGYMAYRHIKKYGFWK